MTGLLLSTALAGGFAVTQQGAVAGGTGHAGVARADDPALAWANPAALADDGGLRFAAGIALATATTEARATSGAWGAKSVTPPGTPPHAYGSWARGPWVVGVAVNTPFAGGVRWPDDWALATSAVASSPTFLRIAPFVGRELGLVRLALGPHVDVGRLGVERRTDHVTSLGWARLQVAGAGVGFDAAALLTLSDAVAVGVTYKSRTSIPLAGWVDFEVPPSVAGRLPDQRVRSGLVLPDRLAVGGRADAGPVSVLVDAEWLAWSVNRATVFDFESPDTPDTVLPNRWRDALAVRAGVEGAVGRLILRGGGYLDGLPDAPAPRDTLSPASPDGVRLAATVGAGLQATDAVRVDGFAELLRVLARPSTAPGVDAAFRTRAVVAGLTVSVEP